jgi:hypothetical protein
MLEELDIIDESRKFSALIEAAIKQATTTQNNMKVRPRNFNPGDLVLLRTNVGNKNAREGKLASNWEGPYKANTSTGTGTYVIETLDDLPILRTWNADKLKHYYCYVPVVSSQLCNVV